MLDHPFTLGPERPLGATRLASTPSRTNRAWLGIAVRLLDGFPEFGRCASDRFQSDGQKLPRECYTTELRQRTGTLYREIVSLAIEPDVASLALRPTMQRTGACILRSFRALFRDLAQFCLAELL